MSLFQRPMGAGALTDDEVAVMRQRMRRQLAAHGVQVAASVRGPRRATVDARGAARVLAAFEPDPPTVESLTAEVERRIREVDIDARVRSAIAKHLAKLAG